MDEAQLIVLMQGVPVSVICWVSQQRGERKLPEVSCICQDAAHQAQNAYFTAILAYTLCTNKRRNKKCKIVLARNSSYWQTARQNWWCISRRYTTTYWFCWL